MKKLIAMFLIMGLLLSLGAIGGATSNASANLGQMDIDVVSSKNDKSHPETAASFTIEAAHVRSNSVKNVERENGLVTIEYLEILSWNEISENYKNLFTCGDDLYLKNVIMRIDRDDDFDIKNSYILSRNGLVYLTDTTYDIMCQKLQIIIDKYNAVNEIQIKLYTEQYDDKPGHMNITLLSSNNPATYVGEFVKLTWGALLHESSQNFGSGNSSKTFYIDCARYCFASFSFIPEDYIVLVNGISYLDDNGNIISSKYITFDEVISQNINIPIDFGKNYMLHICTNQTDLGWIVPEDVKSIP